MRTRLVTLGAVLIIALGACGWTQPSFDTQHGNANPFESRLTPTNVGQLQRHSVTVPGGSIQSSFVVGNWLIVNIASDAIAYDRHACPRADNGACTPLWTRAGQQFRSSDGRTAMVFTTGVRSFTVTDMAGTKLWDGSEAFGTYLFSPDAFGISAGNLLVPAHRYLGHGSSTSSMEVFPLAGCGAPSCSAINTFTLGSGPNSYEPWAAIGHTVFTRRNAFDADTGTALWAFNLDHCCDVKTHGTEVYLARGYPDYGTDVYDASGSAGCSGNPKTCQPIRYLPTGGVGAISDQVTAVDANAKVSFYATTADGCIGGPPAVCSARATTTSLGTVGGVTTVTPHLVFATGAVSPPLIPATNYSLYAFDGDLEQGCSGTPKVCAPLFTYSVTNVALAQVETWDGRVYAVGSDGTLNVFSLPGDVS